MFNRDDAKRILDRAMGLQARDADTLSADELKDSAREAGIDPRYVNEAINERNARHRERDNWLGVVFLLCVGVSFVAVSHRLIRGHNESVGQTSMEAQCAAYMAAEETFQAVQGTADGPTYAGAANRLRITRRNCQIAIDEYNRDRGGRAHYVYPWTR